MLLGLNSKGCDLFYNFRTSAWFEILRAASQSPFAFLWLTKTVADKNLTSAPQHFLHLRCESTLANLRPSLPIQRTGVVARLLHRPRTPQGVFFVLAALWRLCMGGFGLPGFYDRSTTLCTAVSLSCVVANGEVLTS